MPLMFASTALFGSSHFPAWMTAISDENPISFSALLGRSFMLGTPTNWDYFGYLVILAGLMLAVGDFVSSRWMKVE